MRAGPRRCQDTDVARARPKAARTPQRCCWHASRCHPDTWPMSPGESADVARTPGRCRPACRPMSLAHPADVVRCAGRRYPQGCRECPDLSRMLVGVLSDVARYEYRGLFCFDRKCNWINLLQPAYSVRPTPAYSRTSFDPLSDLLRSTLRPPLVDSRTGFDTRADQHRSTRVSTPCALWPRLNQGRDEVVVFSDRRPPPIGQHRLVIRATAMTTVDS